MNFKYLTFCLMSLGLSACSQHVIKSNQTHNLPLEQYAINGVNTIFDHSSYDIKGQLSFQLGVNHPVVANKSNTSALDLVTQKQLDQVLRHQKVKLTDKEKANFYQAVAQKRDPYAGLFGATSRYGENPILTSFSNILNDTQISYEGSVHYSKKMAALDVTLKYQKPTLLVQAKLPMVLDFNDFKFYTNYFAFAPFLVNSESQGHYAYIDFSKYKNDLNKIKFKELVNYFKQANALPYVLAEPNQIALASLTEKDRALGIQKKIRYRGDIESLFLQMELFRWVNEPYLTTQILGQHESDIQNSKITLADDDVIEAKDAIEEITRNSYDSAERVDQLITEKLHAMTYHGDEYQHEDTDVNDENHDEVAYATVEDCDECDVVAAVEEEIDQDSVTITEQACEALMRSKKVPIGYYSACREEYEIDVFNQNIDKSSEQQTSSAIEKLKPIFKEYQSETLIDAVHFKQLWQQHSAEIEQALSSDQDKPYNKTVFLMDVGLDQRGQLISMDYDIRGQSENIREIHILSQNQILNYGHATPIDMKLLKNAKSVKEITHNSFAESFSSDLLTALEPSAGAEHKNLESNKKLDEYLEQIALDTYQRTHFYLKSYQAVFAIYSIVSQPSWQGHYSATELDEIAEVYAYHFNDDLPPLKGAALARLNRLIDKHQLKNSVSFDDLGYTVNQIVKEAIEDAQMKQKWAVLIQQHKTKQGIFAAYYQQLFKHEYEQDQKIDQYLAKASEVYAQAFMDDLKDQLSEKSLKNMKEEYEGLFDSDIYQKAYVDVQQYFLTK